MNDDSSDDRASAVLEARREYPATEGIAYLDTAAVGLPSRLTADTYHRFIDDWTAHGLDYVRAESAAEVARAAVAALIGADTADVALIASVSASAGLIAAQFGPARPGANVVIGEREYSSNHFPWRQLAAKGYEVRQVPFRNGGVEPAQLRAEVDRGTELVAFSAVQTATGHRSDIAALSEIARSVGAIVFVDGSQMVGALPIAHDLEYLDVLVTPDHKYLTNAGRGLGYCYLSARMQDRCTPINAGWKAGAVPFDSFFGPEMILSTSASRFDNSNSFLAAIGNEAALESFTRFGPDAIYERNRALAGLLRASLTEAGWAPIDLPEANRSTIVSVPLPRHDPAAVLNELRRSGVRCSARDGNLRAAVHFYNHEDDIDRLVAGLAAV
ncbi:MAG: aminotransferase class V-fold PLP-dependent enzyme [Acidimicrobiales bacterium]|nr:aminotransferase class V-fold PLP-dependent enzyme [Acidimicrobiales bacterium]